MTNTNRYQHCTWWVKLGRWLWWKPRTPYWALRFYLKGDRDYHMLWSQAWSLAQGYADVGMNYVYDWDEVRDEIWDEI